MSRGPRFDYWKGVLNDMMMRSGYFITPQDMDGFTEALVKAGEHKSRLFPRAEEHHRMGDRTIYYRDDAPFPYEEPEYPKGEFHAVDVEMLRAENERLAKELDEYRRLLSE